MNQHGPARGLALDVLVTARYTHSVVPDLIRDPLATTNGTESRIEDWTPALRFASAGATQEERANVGSPYTDYPAAPPLIPRERDAERDLVLSGDAE
jgi:hypothetical protein